MLAAASLVVDYVLTVAVSLAAGAASLGSVFPGLAHHLLLVSLVALVILTAINMFGIAESAKVLLLPAAVFLVSVFAVIIVGPFHSHPVATIGTPIPIKATEALGILLLLKAFAAGCSALTGVEAIANGVPAFRKPRARNATKTEVSLGVLLGAMLIGLAVLARAHHVVPRGGVTILAQMSAGAFGTGWTFYVSNIAVALVLGLAANTSFGGLPVLMSLLARDHRLPHLFYLRAERPVYRHGIVALALAAAAVADRGQRGDQPPDPALRDRCVPRLHDQSDRPRPPLAPSAPAELARPRHAQRHRRGDDRRRGDRVPGQQVPRGRVGRRDRRYRC